MYRAGGGLPMTKKRLAVLGMLATLPLTLGALGCESTGRISVTSQPPGAIIRIDGDDSGLRTPADVELSTEKDKYIIGLDKPGYNRVVRRVQRETEVDPLTPKEAAASILCAPCCLGLPLCEQVFGKLNQTALGVRWCVELAVESQALPGTGRWRGDGEDPAGRNRIQGTTVRCSGVGPPRVGMVAH
ncbi:PEGA domain-containing protein [Planctomycetota bacterium]